MTLITGEWKWENDSAGSIKVAAPDEKFRVAEGRKAFAEGRIDAILAKGGPTGAWLWAHVHGIHNDRHGESYYTGYIEVVDESGWPYFVTPPFNQKVEGVLDKPDRHRHGYGRFAFSPGSEADVLRAALQSQIPLKVIIVADRTRDDGKWLKNQLPDNIRDVAVEYVFGSLGIDEYLKLIRTGKEK